MPDLKIRPLKSSDFDQWLPLWNGYNLFYERTGQNALPLEVTKTTWSRFLDESEPIHALVAELNGQLVGFTHFLYHRSTSMIERNCYLQDLYTLESQRGNGIGKALIEAVYNEAKKAGSSRVYWQTHETNETAIKLYNKIADRSGFIVYRKKL